MHTTVKTTGVATGVGVEVRNRREVLGLSRAELAVKAGVSADSVAQVERGEVDAKTSTLLALAIALDTTPDALLGLE